MKNQELNKQDAAIVEIIRNNLASGHLWQKGYISAGAPENSKGMRYRGKNAFLLEMMSCNRGYLSNKWYTFKYIKDNGLNFKFDDNGVCAGTGAGLPVAYFEVYDRNTHKTFSSSVLDGMDFDSRNEYIKKYVYGFQKFSTVFNGDLIEGLPADKNVIDHITEGEKIPAAEELIAAWDEKQCHIYFDGNCAAYFPEGDFIHVPDEWKFNTWDDKYLTVFHELTHSTGAPSRLDRKLSAKFGSQKYADEELVAEFGTLFICQMLGMTFNGDTDMRLHNSAAYIESWLKATKEAPETIITAVEQAAKAEKYVEAFIKENTAETV